MKLAISGKGGVGKTTIAASLAHYLKDQGYQVYAIDADPDANLAQMLGIEAEVKPLVELKDIIEEKVGEKGGLFTLNPDVDDVVEDYALEHEGLRFLRMGKVKNASSACYCPENSFLRAIINSLVFTREEAVILDMGAGIEHLTRGTASGVDLMLIVCEPSRISLETGNTIEGLAREAGIPRIAYIANKVRSEKEKGFLEQQLGEKLAAIISYDEELLLQGITDAERPKLLTAEMEKLMEQVGLAGKEKLER